ncbi:MAG: CopG family transcriptional regulator [Butyrivibrio sp.]|nr:CopG family transcriptional regulator [Butyrivibrio sp.]
MAEIKNKGGRPAIDNPRRSPVTVRLTADEYSRLKEYAELHSQTITQVILEGIEMVYSK